VGRCWLVHHACAVSEPCLADLPRAVLPPPLTPAPRLRRRRRLLPCRFASAVQHECIPQAILGMDVICQAKSGMGKTAVFVISVLQQLEVTSNEVGALVMCHTRELAYQVSARGAPGGRQLLQARVPRAGS